MARVKAVLLLPPLLLVPVSVLAAPWRAAHGLILFTACSLAGLLIAVAAAATAAKLAATLILRAAAEIYTGIAVISITTGGSSSALALRATPAAVSCCIPAQAALSFLFVLFIFFLLILIQKVYQLAVPCLLSCLPVLLLQSLPLPGV